MLVLTIRPLDHARAEEIVIVMPDGREVTVRLTQPRSDKAQLGIAAPADVLIFRRRLDGSGDNRRHTEEGGEGG